MFGALRPEVAEGEPEGHDVFWVVDFPAFEWNEDEGRWEAVHHPFTSPAGDLSADPGTWRARAYDVVFDGWEIGGGSIRISDPAVQERVFELLGIGAEEAQACFPVSCSRRSPRRPAARWRGVRHRPDRGAARRRPRRSET